MKKIGTRVAVIGLALFAMAFVAACGSSGGGGGGGGKKGGSIRIGTTAVDSFDPVLFQTVQSVQVLQLVYPGLVTYERAKAPAGDKVVSGLAEKVPQPTNGGRTYKLRLRKGLMYSDGSPVKASDFAHSVKRLVSQKGPYSSFFTGIVGAAAYQKAGKTSAAIPGIKTNDATGDIEVTLKAPDSKFLYALAEPYAAPTPAAKSPYKSLTDKPPPGAGPYQLKVVDFNREFVLTRNPHFKEVPNVPKGNLDKITGLVIKSVPKMTQDVISGKLDFMTEDPVGDLLPQVRQKYKDRFRQEANPPNTYYFFLNVTLPPFNKLAARQAVNYAIDSRALVRVFGGRLTPGCTFLPPNFPGYKKYPCPYGDPNGPGNVAKAKELVKKSGTAGQSVTVWTNNKEPRPAIVQYYADVLSQIGYKTKIQTLDQGVYFDKVGTKSTKAQTGFTDWYQDFPNPADFFEPLLSGDSLQSTPTSNQGFVNDPVLNKKIAALTKEPNVQKVTSQWGALDQYVVKDKAYIVPYGQEQSTSFFSDRMDIGCAGIHPVWKNDWTKFCLKK